VGRRTANLIVASVAGAAWLGCARGAAAQPANDACAGATPALIGAVTPGTCIGATPDGACTCSGGPGPDVYHTITTGAAGVYTFSLCTGGVAGWDTVLSLHSACPATVSNEVLCDDDGCRVLNGPSAGYTSILKAFLPAGTAYVLRIAGFDAGTLAGPYALSVQGPTARLGACCTPAGCTITTAAACAGPGAMYAGDLSACTLAAGSTSLYTDAGAPSAIPDNDPAGLNRTITVPDAFVVGDGHISLDIAHGFVGDLTIVLSHAGTSVVMIQHVGVGVLGSDATLAGEYTFSDTAAATMWPFAPTPASGHPVPTGAYLCSDAAANVVGLRQAFAGASSAGEWTVRIIDSSPGYTGTLRSWSLRLDRAAGGTCASLLGACCIGTACSSQNSAACASGGGSFHGAGAACLGGAGNPVTCCPANFNGLSGVNIQDIFDYLGAWFARDPRADFNSDGSVGVSDIFAFLNAWFLGC